MEAGRLENNGHFLWCPAFDRRWAQPASGWCILCRRHSAPHFARETTNKRAQSHQRFQVLFRQHFTSCCPAVKSAKENWPCRTKFYRSSGTTKQSIYYTWSKLRIKDWNAFLTELCNFVKWNYRHSKLKKFKVMWTFWGLQRRFFSILGRLVLLLPTLLSVMHS